MNKKQLRKLILGLNSQQTDLLKIIYHSQSIEVSELVKITGYDRTTIQKNIKLLISKQYIKRWQKNLEKGYCFYYCINEPAIISQIKKTFYEVECYKTQCLETLNNNEELDL